MCGQLNFTVNLHNYITLIVHLYVYHNGSHAAHRAGPSAAVKTCIFFRFTPSHTEIQSVVIGEARLLLYQMLILFPDQLLAKDFKAPKNHIL